MKYDNEQNKIGTIETVGSCSYFQERTQSFPPLPAQRGEGNKKECGMALRPVLDERESLALAYVLLERLMKQAFDDHDYKSFDAYAHALSLVIVRRGELR